MEKKYLTLKEKICFPLSAFGRSGIYTIMTMFYLVFLVDVAKLNAVTASAIILGGRIFDALNDVRNIRVAVEETIKHGAHASGAISYTTSPVHNLESYVKLAKEMNIPLVLTNDVHYIGPEDAAAQEVLMCIQTGKTLDEVDWVVCHQANSRIIDHCVRALHADPAKFYKNMDRHGNTSAASIPVALNELAETGQLQPGQTIACIGFGGGLTWGGMIVEYKK